MIAPPFEITKLDNEPSWLGLAANDLHLWLWSIEVHQQYEAMLRGLQASEQQRVMRLNRRDQRQARIVSRYGMRCLLGAYLDRSARELELHYGPLGRPHLQSSEPFNFNLSHSGGWAAMVIAKTSKLGVDIERIREHLPSKRLLRRVLSRRERATLEALDEHDRSTAFCRAWTRKEALLKATGGSIFNSPALIEVSLDDTSRPKLGGGSDRWSPVDWHLHHFQIDTRVIGAIAVDAADWNLVVRQVQFSPPV